MPAAEQPPSSNPILSAYLSFVENTPLVTRYVITLASVTYLLSWLVDPSLAMTNIPFFTIFQWELYRIVTSPILCNSFLNLIFAYFSFVESGKRLEMSVGSAAFGSMLFLLGTATNISYIFLSLLLFILTKNEKYMFGSCGSIWILILSIIASECSKAPIGSKRRLFVIDVPTLYYPLAILALFTILGGFNLSYLLSVAIGYAHGYDKLVRFQVGPSRITKWESSGGCLINFSKRPGWIYGKDAQGMNAWAGTNQQQQQQQSSGWNPTAFVRGRPANPNNETAPLTGTGTVATPPEGGWTPFSQGKGQTLGSATSRSTIASRITTTTTTSPTAEEARAARLEALERRRNTNSNNNNPGDAEDNA